jgi:hypothetical protein
MLPTHDQAFLDERYPSAVVQIDSGMICVLISCFQLPKGFTEPQADLLLRLSPGYPDVPPDMWWFDPFVSRSDGAVIAATESREQYLGREWQRWSRHLDPGLWRAGVDSLESYVSLVRTELVKAAMPLAA